MGVKNSDYDHVGNPQFVFNHNYTKQLYSTLQYTVYNLALYLLTIMRYLKSLAALTWQFDKSGFSQCPVMEQTLVAAPPSLQGIFAVSLGYVCGHSKKPRELSKSLATQTTEQGKEKKSLKCNPCLFENSMYFQKYSCTS